MTIELTPEQANNLVVMLDRVPTKGVGEARALLDVHNTILLAIQAEQQPAAEQTDEHTD